MLIDDTNYLQAMVIVELKVPAVRGKAKSKIVEILASAISCWIE